MISVIVPVYNVERYITQCLSSLAAQSYANLEIICVDDGSTDRSGALCRDFAAKDKRFIVLHQDNQGVSSAINLGLCVAKGEFVGFVDPDDFLDVDFYTNLYKLIRETGVDIAVAGLWREYETAGKSVKMTNEVSVSRCFYDINQAVIYAYNRDVYYGFGMYYWNKLFRAKFFNVDDFNIRCDETQTLASDVIMVGECFLKAEGFAYDEKAYYHYRIREGSLVRSTDFIRRYSGFIGIEKLISKLKHGGVSDYALIWVKRFAAYYASQLVEYAYAQNNKKGLEMAQAAVRKYINEYTQTNLNHIDRLNRIENLLTLKVR